MEYAKIVIAISWALSSWTKAYLIMHNARGGAPLLFRKRLADDEKKFIAFTHMMRLPSPQTTRLPSLFKFIPNLFSLYFPALVVEEFLHFFLLRHFVHIRNTSSFTIRGRPPPPESKDDDCFCLGVGIGTHTTTDMEEDEFGDESCLGELESYCNIPHHVAHKPCMFRWLTMGLPRGIPTFNMPPSQMQSSRPAPVCPKCRGNLAVEIITKDSLVGDERQFGGWRNRANWNSKINALVKDWRKSSSLSSSNYIFPSHYNAQQRQQLPQTHLGYNNSVNPPAANDNSTTFNTPNYGISSQTLPPPQLTSHLLPHINQLSHTQIVTPNLMHQQKTTTTRPPSPLQYRQPQEPPPLLPYQILWYLAEHHLSQAASLPNSSSLTDFSKLSPQHQKHVLAAIKCLDAVLANNNNSGNQFMPAVELKTRFRLSQILFWFTENIVEAEMHLQKAILIAQKMDNVNELKFQIYNLQSRIFISTNNIKAAKNLLKKSTAEAMEWMSVYFDEAQS
ncbi:1975_t:CDS:2 [Ambispora gerdemannii]|uniref:1975_t:CDS:1 n=1 Tax=Ambispora gerdemannii TaxID=144530 RepID=A0A9N8V1A7_9GLOM|nr:1975_t:CDS:2 [Ambispora gerdemannii]